MHLKKLRQNCILGVNSQYNTSHLVFLLHFTNIHTHTQINIHVCLLLGGSVQGWCFRGVRVGGTCRKPPYPSPAQPAAAGL